MKLQVFIRVYGLLILLLISLLIGLYFGLTPFKIYGRTVFVICMGGIAFLTDRRYVQKLTISDNRLTITYVTNFLQTRTDQFELKDIVRLTLDKRRSISVIWPPNLHIRYDGDYRNYTFISKDLYDDAEAQIAIAGPGTAMLRN